MTVWLRIGLRQYGLRLIYNRRNMTNGVGDRVERAWGLIFINQAASSGRHNRFCLSVFGRRIVGIE